MNLNERQLRKLLNSKLSFEALLNKYGDYHYSYKQRVFCPFHDNHNTPAAVLYPDDDGSGDKLWCFSEQKQFRPFDYIKDVLGQDPYKIAKSIWDSLPDYEKEVEYNKLEELNYEELFAPTQTKEDVDKILVIQAEHQFKNNKVNLDTFLKTYYNVGDR